LLQLRLSKQRTGITRQCDATKCDSGLELAWHRGPVCVLQRLPGASLAFTLEMLTTYDPIQEPPRGPFATISAHHLPTKFFVLSMSVPCFHWRWMRNFAFSFWSVRISSIASVWLHRLDWLRMHETGTSRCQRRTARARLCGRLPFPTRACSAPSAAARYLKPIDLARHGSIIPRRRDAIRVVLLGPCCFQARGGLSGTREHMPVP
jgi:hypothetical protein